MAAGAAGASSACDQGTQHDQQTQGPPIELIEANVGPSKPLPSNGSIVLRFNRYLLPESVNRQSIVVIDGQNNALSSVLITYDPVTLSVTISNPGGPPGEGGAGTWLVSGQPYKVQLGIPQGDSDTGGIRAIDRATLDPATQLTIGFSAADPTPTVAAPPTMSFCNDIYPIFLDKCSLGTCHGSPVPNTSIAPAASLELDLPGAVEATAVQRTAQGSNTGPTQTSSSQSHLFGIDMPLIDVNHAANSWLLYKTLLGPLPPSGQSPQTSCGAAPQLTHVEPNVAKDDERAILSNYILGREMPFPTVTDTDYTVAPLTFEERERISLWIAQGALIPSSCAGCATIPQDAGTSDAGTSDSGSGDASDQ